MAKNITRDLYDSRFTAYINIRVIITPFSLPVMLIDILDLTPTLTLNLVAIWTCTI